jgi:hypothetical protein
MRPKVQIFDCRSNNTFLLPTHIVFILSLILLYLCILAPSAHSGAVTLAWDPNSPSEEIAGYRLYYGSESRNYTSVIDITNGTLKKISKLDKGYHYYFAVTAYNQEGQESDFSEELAVNTCTYKLSPGKKTFKPEGGVSMVKIVTQPNCEWTATSGADWLEIIDGHDGTGTGIITYLVEPNPTPETRVSSSTFGGKKFNAKQKGSALP